jgi:hypothetical protein
MHTPQGGSTTGGHDVHKGPSRHGGQVSQDFRGAVVYELQSYRLAHVKAEVIFAQ